MKAKEFDHSQFIKIAAGSTLVMLNNRSPALFAKVAVPKSRSHYKVFSSGKIGNLHIKNRLKEAASATAAITGVCRFLSGGIDMYQDGSKGGVELINTRHVTVTPISPRSYNHNLT